MKKYEAYILQKTDKGFKALGFVLKARRMDDSMRAALKLLHVDENIVCTDGVRLHYAPNETGLPEGDYEIRKANTKEVVLFKNEGETYPNYKHIILGKERNHSLNAKAKTLQYMLGKANGPLLQPLLIEDALPLPGVVEWDDELTPVSITHDLGKAVIMPVRQQ